MVRAGTMAHEAFKYLVLGRFTLFTEAGKARPFKICKFWG